MYPRIPGDLDMISLRNTIQDSRNSIPKNKIRFAPLDRAYALKETRLLLDTMRDFLDKSSR